jgi:hypothetical protein
MRLRWECKNSPNQLLPLPLLLFLFLRLLDLFQPITNVISTEGGALRRRSGEIPVFSSFALALALALAFALAVVLAVVSFTSSF